MSYMYFSIDDFIAGWCGGMCGLVVGHPFDTIKVRQQNYGTSFWETVFRTKKYEGFRGFYKGMFFPLLTVGPSNAIFFGVYGNLMRFFQHETHHSHRVHEPSGIHHIFWAGCIAGIFQVLFFCPVELAKTVLQAKTGGRGSWKKHYEVDYTGTFDAFRKIYIARGFKGLYRGGVAMAWRDVPTSGIYTLAYEVLLYDTFEHWNTVPLVCKQMIAGGVAGFLAWIVVIPVDNVKSRIEADNPDNRAYQGTIDCFIKTYKMGGWKFFFKGLLAISIRAFPVNGAINVGYETMMLLLNFGL